MSNLTLSLLVVTQEAFVDSADQDHTAQKKQSIFDLHFPLLSHNPGFKQNRERSLWKMLMENK